MNVEVLEVLESLSINQKAALERFEKCYVSKNGDGDALKACLQMNINPELIYDIIIYHKEAKDFTEYANSFGWEALIKHKELPERFIKENIDKFKWDDICSYQYLSEDFIREYKDKVNWTLLFLRDIEYSPEFLSEFQGIIKKSIINVLYSNANNSISES